MKRFANFLLGIMACTLTAVAPAAAQKANFQVGGNLKAYALTSPTEASAGEGGISLAKLRGSTDLSTETLERARGMGTVALAVKLQILSQSMTNRSLLAALGVDKREQIVALMGERENFIAIMGLLRYGHKKIGVHPARRPMVLERLARLEKEWSVFGPTVAKIINTGTVTKQNVAIVAECIKPLEEGTRELINAYEHFATGGRTFSAVTPMVKNAEALQALVKEMTAEYLLIAYGYEIKEYRAKLGHSYQRFDRTLKALIKGDPALRIVPAPNQQIGTELRLIQKSWYPLARSVYNAVMKGQVSRNYAPTITNQADWLAGKMDKAVSLYRRL